MATSNNVTASIDKQVVDNGVIFVKVKVNDQSKWVDFSTVSDAREQLLVNNRIKEND